MKKVMFALAIAGMFAFAACNNNNAEEVVEDTTAIEAIEEVATETVDSAVEAMAEEVVENAEAAQN